MSFFRQRNKANAKDPLAAPTTSSPKPKIFPAGIQLLHSPAAPSDAVVDIVFVHGLTGGREKTWTAAGAPEPWPKALLPSKLPTARVLTFGYDAYVADWRSVVSQARIANHAWNLLTSLAAFRDEDDTNERPIIFVCHSLGGLVCQDALFAARQRSEPHLQSILQSTRGIAFLGTPHHGSALARWAKLTSISIGVIKQTNTEILAVLESDSEVLARIQDGFHTMIQSRRGETQRIEISCFFEEMPLVGVGLVVPQDSAILPGYIPIGIRANHMDMTKFVALDDPGFLAVCGELRRWIKQLAKTPAPRADPLPPPLPAPVVPSDAPPVNALPESQGGQGAPLSIASPPSAAVPPTPDLVAALQHLTAGAASAPLDAASIDSLRDALIFPVGWTTLHGAAYRGDVEGTRSALVAGEDPNKTTVPKLWTPLWVAATYGHTEIAQLLLDAGANANAAIRTGSTAVHEAAIIGSTGILALLIAKGANLELCPPTTRDTALICAASKGHYEAVRLLVEGGANINAQQNGGWAPLHYALHNKDEGMFRLLLQYSADTNIATTTGRRPLHLAALRGLTAQAEELLGRGAHLDPTDGHGLTPLLLAVQAGNLETVQLLVNRGARTNITNRQRQTLLNVANNSGNKDVYAWLAQRRIR